MKALYRGQTTAARLALGACTLGMCISACGGSAATTPGGGAGTAGPRSGSPTLPAASATDLRLTGALEGQTTNGRPDGEGIFCGRPVHGQTDGMWDFIAAINGVDYGFTLSVKDYTTPGSYAFGLDKPASFAVGIVKALPGGATETDYRFQAVSGSMVVDASQVTGTIDADLTGSPLTRDSTAVGHIKGVWACAGRATPTEPGQGRPTPTG